MGCRVALSVSAALENQLTWSAPYARQSRSVSVCGEMRLKPQYTGLSQKNFLVWDCLNPSSVVWPDQRGLWKFIISSWIVTQKVQGCWRGCEIIIEQISSNLSGHVQVILQCKIKRKNKTFCFEKLQSIFGSIKMYLAVTVHQAQNEETRRSVIIIRSLMTFQRQRTTRKPGTLTHDINNAEHRTLETLGTLGL